MTNLIVISNETDLEDETALVNELFAEGLGLLHLRKPNWNIEQQRTFLKKIDSNFLNKISVHQHHETISEFGLKYFHVKDNNREKTIERNEELIYSTSFHNYNDLQFESHLWNYCFLSPVFDSISKINYKSNFGENFEVEADLYQRVFALGGINKDNIDRVFEKGFYGAAVLGSVWKEPKSAIENFIKLNRKVMLRNKTSVLEQIPPLSE